MRKYNIPIFIPHRGCPHDCVFCNQRKITGVDTEVTPELVRGLIEEFLRTVNTDNSQIEIAFFGGSFTGLDMKLQEDFLSVAAEFFPVASGIRLSTRPDYINVDVMELLKKYRVTTVELGVQSSCDEVLSLNNRGHNFEDVIRATRLIREYGISVGHQMMLGMYGSSPDKDKSTVDDIISLMPDCVRIYPVVTLAGTRLEALYREGCYTPYTVMEAAEQAKNAIVSFNEAGIEVIRVGLHSSEDLNDEGEVVAGPYHPAFGEIAKSLIYRDKIEEAIIKEDIRDCEFVYKCPKGDTSKAIGHKGINRDYFMEKYGVRIKILSE